MKKWLIGLIIGMIFISAGVAIWYFFNASASSKTSTLGPGKIELTAGASTVIFPNDPSVLEIKVKNTTKREIPANQVQVVIPMSRPAIIGANYSNRVYSVQLIGFENLSIPPFIDFDNICTNGSPVPVGYKISGANAVVTIPCAIAPDKSNLLSIKMINS